MSSGTRVAMPGVMSERRRIGDRTESLGALSSTGDDIWLNAASSSVDALALISSNKRVDSSRSGTVDSGTSESRDAPRELARYVDDPRALGDRELGD